VEDRDRHGDTSNDSISLTSRFFRPFVCSPPSPPPPHSLESSYLAGPKSNLPAAACTAPDIAVIADVADAIGELGFQAYVACGVQLNPRLLVYLRAHPYRFFEDLHLVLLPPAGRETEAKGEKRDASAITKGLYEICLTELAVGFARVTGYFWRRGYSEDAKRICQF